MSNKNVRTLNTCLEIQIEARVGRDQSRENSVLEKPYVGKTETVQFSWYRVWKMGENQVLLKMITLVYLHQTLIEQKSMILI